MLAKIQRLTRQLFNQVFKDGFVVHGDNFYLKAKKGDGEYKFSAVVSKKVHKKAVNRNRLRRQIYAALRDIPGTKNIEGIVFAKAQSKNLTFTEIKNEIMGLVKRIR